MEKCFNFKRRFNKKHLIIFTMVISCLFCFSLVQTLQASEALQTYEMENPKSTNGYLADPDEKVLSRNHQLHLTVTIFIILFALIFSSALFFSRNRLRIDKKGICILGLTGKKYIEKYYWEKIKRIEIAYPQGFSSILFEKSLIIHREGRSSISLPIERFEKERDIVEVIQSKKFFTNFHEREIYHLDEGSLLKIILDTVSHIMSHLKIYFILSAIILLFTLIDKVLINSSLASIASLALFYFGVKANIVMNIFSYESFTNRPPSLKLCWEKTKGKFWRYFSTVFLQSIIRIPFFLLILYFSYSNANIYAKGFMITMTCIGLISITAWLFLLPYIASVTTSKKSYFSLNASLLKKVYRKILPLIGIEFLLVIVPISISWYRGTFNLMNIDYEITISGMIIDFIKIPFYSAYIMHTIHKAPFFNRTDSERVKEIV